MGKTQTKTQTKKDVEKVELTEDKKIDLQVIKRNGRKVNFDGTKIAVAIQKGFDAVLEETGEKKYEEKDINKVYNKVLNDIAKISGTLEKIRIEEIQDLIEKNLKTLKYTDVYEAFSSYRERRKRSREIFLDAKRQHKFIKVIESLGLPASENDIKRENANVDGDSAMGQMLQYGSTVSKEFAQAYLINKEALAAHEDGEIHIHDMDFLPMGTTTCCQIDLNKLFDGGFSTGHGHLREPQSIMSYSSLAAIAIQANQNDQHGGQSIPAFDFFMAPGVLKTFKKELKQEIRDMIDFTDSEEVFDFDKILEVISDIKTIDLDVDIFKEFTKDSAGNKRLFKKAIEKAFAKTDRATYQAMEAFVHNLNTMHSRAGAQVPFSSINFGTDVSPEGRMVLRNYLLAVEAGLGKGETPIFPISIFKVKSGVNYNPEDPNYDIFKLACRVSAKRLFPNFSFIDAPYNLALYKEGDYRTEVGYMGCRTRVLANTANPDKAITPGRGNLSFTSVNLPRLGIKYGIVNNDKPDLEGFYNELEETLNIIKKQLLDRFKIQSNKRVYNFPFLMAEGVWMDGDKLKKTDKLGKILKNGTLTIGFIGLAECLTALIGEHHGESDKAQKLGLDIIQFMRDKCDEFAEDKKLNFTLIATPAEGLSGRFTRIDQAVYGKIKGVTDKNYYTNSFHIPVSYKISAAEKIKKEAKYHALTNAGHITYIELDGDTTENLDAFEKVIRMMHDEGIGYGAINHPVDRDPVCGFTGIINDQCPGCTRKEDDVKFERIRRITGYLVGTVDRFNNAKKSEENDREKHSL